MTKKIAQPTRKEREGEFRRELVLDIAESLFAEKGFSGTTVSDIAEKSELAKGSLYQLFKSKEEIITAILKRKVEHVWLDVKQLLKEPISPLDKLRLIMRMKLTDIWESRHFARIFIHELRGFHWIMDNPISDEIRDHIEFVQNQMKKLIVEGQREGEFRKDLPSDMIHSALAGFSNAVVFDWLENEEMDLETALAKFDDIFLNGVGVKK